MRRTRTFLRSLATLSGSRRTAMRWGVVMCALLTAVTFAACRKSDAVEQARKGRLALDAKQYDVALAAFNRSLEIDPEHDDARLGRGRVYEEQHQFEQAIDEYKAVLKHTPRHVAAHLILANAYRRIGDLPQAIANAEKAAELSPGEAWIRNIIGMLLEQKGDLRGAKERFEEAIGIVSNDAEFHINLAKVLEKLNERERAIAEYTAFIQLVTGLEKYREQINFCTARIRALRGGGAVTNQ